jgi:hypothetical protein
MINRADLHDQLVVFIQHEHRGGFLLADPLIVCTIGFWEHLTNSSRRRIATVPPARGQGHQSESRNCELPAVAAMAAPV